jgi:hypothetical protein
MGRAFTGPGLRHQAPERKHPRIVSRARHQRSEQTHLIAVAFALAFNLSSVNLVARPDRRLSGTHQIRSDGIRLAHRVRDNRANRRNHCERAILESEPRTRRR